MSKRVVLIAVAAVLPLAACDSGPSVDVEDASVGEVAQELAEAGQSGQFISPGLWRSTVEFENIEMPELEGMPPEAVEQMNRQMGLGRTFESCMTPEQVQQPDSEFFGGGDTCRYERFTMSGGRIAAAMTCGQGAHVQRMTMEGSYSPDSYNVRTRVEGSGAGGNMTMLVKAQRVGDCPAQ